MITFLAILTLLAQAGLLVVLIEALIARIRRVPPSIAGALALDSLRLAAVMAVVATASSLYFSQVRHFIPCELCWFQRIFMYPLAIILPIAAFRRDVAVWRYALPIAVIGVAISTYHAQLERFPNQEHIACTTSVPCTAIWFSEFGYITISVMALTAFASIITLLTIGARHGTRIPS